MCSRDNSALTDDQDATAIEQTLRTLQTAIRSRDADVLRNVYVADADWTNAFGTTLSGRDAIVAYLKGLFADVHFGAVRLIGAPCRARPRVVSNSHRRMASRIP
jgi:uncharacterized protein (TIGR02246 family)